MKKINGWLIVRFNERERREYEELGAFGVIDAEAYTGSIDIDRGEMEYDDAETIEQAVEQARGLDSEEDYAQDEPQYSIVKESASGNEEISFSPQGLIDAELTALRTRVAAQTGDTNTREAAHELRGFAAAFNALRINEDDALFDIDALKPSTASAGTFRHASEKWLKNARKMYALGVLLASDCPQNDCTIYRNTFEILREIDEQLDRVTEYPWIVLHNAYNHEAGELERMYLFNHAVREYRRTHGDAPVGAVPAPAPTPAKEPSLYRFSYTPNEITDREMDEMSALYEKLFCTKRTGDLDEFFNVYEHCIELDKASIKEPSLFVRPRLYAGLGEELRRAWKLYYKSPEICAYLREQEKAKKEPPAEQTARECKHREGCQKAAVLMDELDRYEEIENGHPYTAEAMTGRTLPYQPGDKTIDRLQGVMEEVSRRQTGRQGA